MRLLFFVFIFSACGTLAAILNLLSADWLLLSVPCALASALILFQTWLRNVRQPKNWAIIDGSNVMHWNGGTPNIDTVAEVISTLTQAGLTPGVVFDANAGYKLSGHYMKDSALASHLGLPISRVLVAPNATPADPLVLQAAKDLGAAIVTNDRFRDWAEDYSDVLATKKPIGGGYRKGELWLSL